MNSTSPVSSSSYPTLKRTRPGPDTGALGRSPPLPKLSNELILEIFTHISLRRPGSPEEYGDNQRLAMLGSAALDVAVTHALFSKRPLLKVSELCSQREQLLSDVNVEDWVTMYGMRQKLRCHPDVFPVLNNPKEARSVFCSYVGGVYTEHGIEVVQDWVSQLLGHDNETPPQPLESAPLRAIETPPPPKKIKSEQWYHSNQPSTIFFASQPPASPVRQMPPHLSVPNPLAPAQPNLPFLPLFNQTATQRRVTVEYPAVFDGPSHAGRWTVQCVVNGISKGVGTGSSKQVAKEEAAKQAYYAMGWT